MQDSHEPKDERQPRVPEPEELAQGAEPAGTADGPEAPAVEEGAGAPEPGRQELVELKDRLLRTLAEMENLRARTARDVEDARKYAVTGFARSMLDVADNLARALAAVPDEARGANEFIKNLVVGVEMTERALHGVLERHQIKRLDPQLGERFDHGRHQAMFEVPTDATPPGTIAEVMQPGYMIADRLLRPALVGVAKAPARGNGEAPGDPVDVEA